MEPIVSVAWLVALVVGACAQPPAATSPHALYHLSAVRRSVDLAKRSLVTTSATRHVFKRSADVKADDLFLHSVASYCDSFRTNPDILAYFERSKANLPLKATDISGHAKFTPTQKLRDDLNKGDINPEVLPVKVQAQREGDVVWLIFHIAHSEAAKISRIDPFDFQTSGLDMPQDSCQKVISKARFHINVSAACSRRDPDFHQLFSGFKISGTEKSRYEITVSLNLCRFNVDPNYYESKKTLAVSENIEIPNIRVLTHSDDVIYIEPNVETQANLEVNISIYDELSVRLVTWDLDSGETAQYSASIGYDRQYLKKIEIDYLNSNTMRNSNSSSDNDLFRVDVLNSTKLSDRKTCLTLGIILKKVPKNHGGKLTFNFVHKKFSLRYGDVVHRIRVERSLDVRHRDGGRGLHTPLVYFRPPHTFQCAKGRGDMKGREARFGWNCTVRCHAHGSDIASIFISRLGAHTLLVTSASYVLPGDAVAIMNVGVASPDNEGAYQCVAVDKQGRTSTVGINLYTSLLTIIEYFGIDSDRYLFDSAKLLCVVSGGKDLELSIYAGSYSGNLTRIDMDERFNRQLGTDADNKTTLTIAITWTELGRVGEFIRCLATGQRGQDSSDIDMSYFIQHKNVFS